MSMVKFDNIYDLKQYYILRLTSETIRHELAYHVRVTLPSQTISES